MDALVLNIDPESFLKSMGPELMEMRSQEDNIQSEVELFY
jgi:hypothetical protein